MSDFIRCQYIIPRKNRSCRMLCKPGKKFCGEHALFDPENAVTNNDSSRRIPCPLDPKHTILECERDDHIRNRCNSRLREGLYIKENYNVVPKCDLDSAAPDLNRIAVVAPKVEEVFEKYKHLLIESQSDFPVIETELTNSEMGNKRRKHLTQQSSILGHLMTTLDTDSICFAEFGAGKGQLSYWLQQSRRTKNHSFLLIDRAGSRNKFENKALQLDSELDIHRIRCSIEHLDLANVELLKKSPNLVTICKHLCGCATDLAIRCIFNAQKSGINIQSCALAPCCHHRLEFSQYVGIEFLESEGIPRSDFALLRHFSTWATCGIQLSKTRKTVETEDWELSASEKEMLGRKTKFLLELGRANFMKCLGFDLTIFQYVTPDLTPENLLIVAKKKC